MTNAVMNRQPDYATHLPGGHHWSLRLRRGTTLTLTAKQADSNVGLLCYNPENLLERLNLPDTLKCQHTFKLTQGHCLYSDMGRIFASMTHDDLGWHDSVGGNLMPQHLLNKGWQPVSYQQAHNHWTRTGFDAFLVELAKYGLGRRDMAANLNLFSRVESDDEGSCAMCPATASRATVSRYASRWIPWCCYTPARTRWIPPQTIHGAASISR